MAEPALYLYQCGACCFEFTSDYVWQYFFKHLCVDDKGNILPPLGKWEKRINAEKTVPIISGISEIFAQMDRAHTSRFMLAKCAALTILEFY